MIFRILAYKLNSKLIVSCNQIRTAKMSTLAVYLRWKDGSNTFDYTFNVNKPEIGVSRQFNFCRQINETIEAFKHRLTANLEKGLKKKKKKRKNEEGAQKDEQNLGLDFVLHSNGKSLPSESICKDVLFNGDAMMKLFDDYYIINVNYPWIVSYNIPVSILAGFPIYPSGIELDFAKKEDCTFIWYRSNLNKKDEWVKVGEEFFYTPTIEDIDCYLKLEFTPRNKDLQGPTIEKSSESEVQAGPGQSPFDVRHLYTTEKLNGNTFRIMSYNILADLYADSDFSRTSLFPYCPAYALAIDYRKQLILKELIGYNSDIICLQEVDLKVFDHDLIPVLSSINYNGVFNKKGAVNEGLACLYRQDRFKLLSSEGINLADEITKNEIFHHMYATINSNDALKSRILDRGTTLQVNVLQSLENEEILLLGNTHLYFHPDADHIRLLQAAACLYLLQHKLEQLKKEFASNRVSLIFCGDFNSTPEFGVYKLMTQKFIPSDYSDWASNDQEAVKELELSHNIHLESACGTPKFTNFTAGFAGCLDYIFYQRDHLDVKHFVPLPSEEVLRQHIAIPSVVLPSDHIALIADLKWK